MKYISTFEEFVNEKHTHVNENEKAAEIKEIKKFGMKVSKILKAASNLSTEGKDKVVTALLPIFTPFDSDVDMELPDPSDYDADSFSEIDEDDLEDYDSELDDGLSEYADILDYSLKDAIKIAKSGGEDDDDDDDWDEEDDDDNPYSAYKTSKRRLDEKINDIKKTIKKFK